MIYTDSIHLVADTLEELHEWAGKLGLSRSRYHGVKKGHPHYDMTGIANYRFSNLSHAKRLSKKEIFLLSRAMVNNPMTTQTEMR